MNKDIEYQNIFDECVKAGKEAIKNEKDNMYCGFAWCNVKPGTSSFAKWLVKKGLAHSSYSGGVDIWAGSKLLGFDTQCMDIKEAFVLAFTCKLQEYGIKCSAKSRAD